MGFHKVLYLFKKEEGGYLSSKYRPMLIFWNLMITDSEALCKVPMYLVALYSVQKEDT